MNALEIEALRMIQRVLDLEARVANKDGALLQREAEEISGQGVVNFSDSKAYAEARYAVGYAFGAKGTAQSASALLGAFIAAAEQKEKETHG